MSTSVNPIIDDRLTRFVRRQRRMILFRAASVAIAFWILAILGLMAVDAWWVLDRGPRFLLTVTTHAVAIGLFGFLSIPGLTTRAALRRAALAVEGARPELKDRLLSAVELATDSARGSFAGSRAFIEAAQRDVASRLSRIEIRDLLPLRLIRRPLLAATCLLVVAGSLLWVPDFRYGTRLARAIIPGIDLDRVSRTRLEIRSPDPASTTVPANEWTPVRVLTSGRPVQSGRLQWESEEGRQGEIEMKPWGPSDAEASSEAVDGDVSELVCHLPIAESVIRYRVLAGDGVTAWHRLEPKSRPQITGFRFAVEPPEYTRLPTETVAAEQGHLRVLEGSRVTITARFAAPVVAAELRLVDEDVRVPMTDDGEADGAAWSGQWQVNRADRYQVLARDAVTGFDNSLSPQFDLVPVPDQPPQIDWLDPVDRSSRSDSPAAGRNPGRRLIPSRASLALAAEFRDEMPIEEAFQETAINRGPWTREPSALSSTANATATAPGGDSADRRTWVWDVASLAEADQPLRPGDLLRTRLVAIDRKGQRGESQVREFLISDQAFDARKRDNFKAWTTLVSLVADWSVGVGRELERLGLEPSAEATEPDRAEPPAVPSAQQAKAALDQILSMNRNALHDSEAGELEMLARGLAEIDAELARAAAVADPPADPLRELAKAAAQIETAARQTAAHRLCVILADDMDRMHQSLEPLVDPDSGILWESFGNYHRVTAQQFQEMLTSIDAGRASVPDSTRSHQEALRRWIEGWLQRLADQSDPAVGEQRVRGATLDLTNDIAGRRRYGMLDGRLPSLLVESQNRLHERFGFTTPAIRAVQREFAAENDSSRVAAWPIGPTATGRVEELEARLRRDAEMNLRRPEADRRYVTDVRLLVRVLEQLRVEGYEPPEERSPAAVLEDLAGAFHQLEAGHLWNQWLIELRTLADTERWDIDTATARLDAPRRWERLQRGLDHALTGLERAGIGWETRKPLHDAVRDREMSRISAAIVARRWQRIPAVSLADDLDDKHAELFDIGQSLVPLMASARRRLEAYLPDLSELARDTAQALRDAERQARQEPAVEPGEKDPREEAQKDAQALDELRQKIEEQAAALREGLIDEANTQDLTSDEGLERAREADIASRAIDRRMREAAEATREAVNQADQATDPPAARAAINAAADPLGEAARTLEQIASHYEDRARRAAGEAPGEGPSPLMQLQEELELQEQLDQEFARSQMLADAIQSDPREMLDRLAQELKRNEAMREELKRIAQRSIRDAQQTLQQQAQRERELRLELERQDPGLLDEKRRLEDAIRQAVDHTSAAQRSRLHTARQAIARLDQKTLSPPLNETAQRDRQRLEESIESLQQATQAASTIGSAEQELMNDLHSVAENLREQLAESTASLEAIADSVERLGGDPEAALPGDPRKVEQRDMQNLQRQARDTLAGAVRSRQNRVNQAAGQSEQQARNARGQTQQSERQLAEAEKQLQQRPDDPELGRRRDQAAARVEASQTREALAQEEATRRRAAADQAREDLAEIGRTPLPPLDSPRPAAELSESMLEQAAVDLAAQRDALAEAVARAAEAPELRATSESLDASALAQTQVQGEVARASENLSRAARHLERLEDQDHSRPIDEIAQSVAQVAEDSVARANRSLEEASEQAANQADFSAPAAVAAERLSVAEGAIAEQAEALAERLERMSRDTRADGRGDEADSQGDSANQLARTLDELDRSMTQSQRGQESQSPSPQPPGAGEQPSPAGQPNGDTDPSAVGQDAGGELAAGTQAETAEGGAQSASAQTNSPTLAAEARRQMQRLAMRRTLPGEQPSADGPNGPAGEEANAPGESADGQPGNAASSQAGLGNLGSEPDSFRLGTVDPRGGDWGRLRQLEAEDTGIQRRIEVSPEFRSQIEAYFRAIAERGREP
ncbi:MAG: hypothetical protein EA381_04805 [Planctomycetaceae bacterium]|nr:MAG: hypothetical protein EA381_04805 [Planctomycetaceae bacterium]